MRRLPTRNPVECLPMGGILASLLPGLRDLRAPLAAGYLWLAIIWIAWGREQSNLSDRHDLLGDVHGLAQNAGPVAVGVALSFIAYVLGILSINVLGGVRNFTRRAINQFLRSRNRTRRTIAKAGQRILSTGGDDENTREIGEELIQWIPFDWHPTATVIVQERWEQANRQQPKGKPTALFVARFRRLLIKDLPLVPFRLMGKDPELYGEYDRLRSEGDFRLAVADPSLVLTIQLSITESWLWLVALPGVIILQVLGAQKISASNNLLLDAIRAGRVESPVLAMLDAEVQQSPTT
jgi:hypothetical protein